ncbi:MAG TPA: PEP-CTERM sorting domain-containing protein [Edaphobacter sp.]
MLKKLLFLFPIGLLMLVPSAKADTIGPSCGSCMGSSYTLNYETTADPTVFNIFLKIDTTDFTGPATDYLNSVSLKLVSQSSSIDSVTLLSPLSDGFGTTIAGGLSAQGCSGNGGGFFCSESADKGLLVGGIYTFEWQLALTDPNKLFTGIDQASVKALYVTSKGKQNGITSEEITLDPSTPASPVPEPSSLMLFGTGVVGFAAAMRRKLMA